MVDAVVSFVVKRLGELLVEQVVFLRSVRDEVTWLKKNLEWMLCFLKDAEERQEGDDLLRQWVSDVRDVAYDAEDIIDNFILKVEEGGGTLKKMGLKDCFKKYFCICSKQSSLIEQANLYGIGKEINTLKSKLTDIQQYQKCFNLRKTGEVREGSDQINERLKQLRRERPYEDNEYVVGFQKDAELLMSKLVKKVKHRSMIAIVGMGGLGKTTMARKLYNTSSLKDKFDCQAWVSVSKDYSIQDLLQRTIKSFKGQTTKEELELLEKMNVEDLEIYLRRYLEGRRFLVVIDDVWDEDAWKILRRALPDNKNGSRVIMTTRNKVVAEQCDESSYVHELPFLDKRESWELFCKKAFRANEEVGDQKNLCPPNMEVLARDMVSKCSGLPLAIVVLGGLLQRKPHNEWPKLKEHLWHHVNRDDSHHVKLIMALSFNDLPHNLKSCFLYLGLFPEDFEIDAERLCWLWMAEGFMEKGEESTEEDYLKELIDRSFIQVARIHWKRILTCRVHDLLRDFAIDKSKELNFLHIYDGNTHSPLAPKSRRLASHCGFQRFVSLDHSDSRLRTLLFFNLEDESLEISKLQYLCMNLRLLRVLDFQISGYRSIEDILPDEIGKLMLLRHLNLRPLNINKLSPAIGNLHALQTLELSRWGDPIQLPDEICKAKQLRHLNGNFKWPFRVDNMTNLQTLGVVRVEDQMEFNVGDLINLRELEVSVVGEAKTFTLDSIGGLRNLQSLDLEVKIDNSGWYPALQPLSHCEHLQQLRLNGIWGDWKSPDSNLGTSGQLRLKGVKDDWKLPTEVHEILRNLEFLSLSCGPFYEDPMPKLEKLPKLKILKLDGYRGDKLACTAGGFAQLEILVLTFCRGEFQVQVGGMPMLKGLGIGNASQIQISDTRLRSIPAPPPNLNLSLYWPY